jgi:hypothetical protein
MYATIETPFGPELALLVQRNPNALRDSIALAVLREELEGASPEWALSQSSSGGKPGRSGPHGLRSRWALLLGRHTPPTSQCAARAWT